jgi:hypothetical protein
LKEKLARIDENITKYLSQMDEEDNSQQNSSEYTPEQIKAAIIELTQRKEKYIGFLKELIETGTSLSLFGNLIMDSYAMCFYIKHIF